MLKHLFFIFIFLSLPIFCFAYQTDFDNYDLGALNGQEGWLAADLSMIVDSTDCYDDRCLRLASTSHAYFNSTTSWTALREGIATWYQKNDVVSTGTETNMMGFRDITAACQFYPNYNLPDVSYHLVSVQWYDDWTYDICIDASCTLGFAFDISAGCSTTNGVEQINWIHSDIRDDGATSTAGYWAYLDNICVSDDSDDCYFSDTGIAEPIFNQIDCENEGWYWVETPLSSGGYLVPGLIDYECTETATGTCNSTSSGFTTGCQFCSQTDCNATGTRCYWNTDTNMCNAFAHSCGEYTLTQFCTSESDCLTIGHGYWYNGSCHYAQLEEEEASTTAPIVALFADIPLVNKLLPLFLNPQSWIKNQIYALNPMNKPPFSWVIQFISEINEEIEEFENGTYVADASLMADDFGTIEITFLNATTDIALINFKYVRDNYTNSFTQLKVIVSYICWIEFAMFLFFTLRNWINKHSTKS